MFFLYYIYSIYTKLKKGETKDTFTLCAHTQLYILTHSNEIERKRRDIHNSTYAKISKDRRDEENGVPSITRAHCFGETAPVPPSKLHYKMTHIPSKSSIKSSKIHQKIDPFLT